MSIIDLQRRITEAGRIRTGLQEQFQRPDGSTGLRPAKLETFRFTSADRRRIEQIAELYGGTVEPWQAPAGAQWQVISERAELDIIVPPSDLSFSQHYELWSAGGCQRRCDGATEQITEGPCLCDPAARECEIHTRLSVLLRDIPGLGVWRLDTQGWYAAQELVGAVEVITLAAGRGALLPARLRLEQRMVKRPDGNGKTVTRRFAVPVIDIEITPAQLLAGGTGVPLAVAAGNGRPPLTPVPQIAAPVPSIAEQSAPPPERPKRANAAAEIPSSGRRRAPRASTSSEATAEASAQAPAPARSPRSAPRTPPKPTEPAIEPLTPGELRRRIDEAELDYEFVAEVHRARFPNGPRARDLSDEQRGRLWADIERRMKEQPAAADDTQHVPSEAAPEGRPAPADSGSAPAAAAGLSLAELTERLNAAGIAFVYAEAAASERFGEKRLDRLTGEQRAQLADQLLNEEVVA